MMGKTLTASAPAHGMLHFVKCSTHTIPQLLAEIRLLLENKSLQPRTINCLNAHIFNLAWNDAELTTALNQSRIVAADGMAIVWSARLFGLRVEERCNMTEAFRAFMQDSSFPASHSILVGGTEEIAQTASETIHKSCSHLTIVEALSGYLPEEYYRGYFREQGPVDMILLGLGTPKTEKLLHIIAQERPESLIWHIGGGTILYLSGIQKEAPTWMRRAGLQWLHRLLAEPRRMWRRYLIGNIQFVSRSLACWLREALRAGS
ncbi:MAG: hypothetical protein DCC55_20675 [Chloroflexi bacterium]|nr:MAG: hypothetical protein DCC55_20675 [Chloroflexota bacterium]